MRSIEIDDVAAAIDGGAVVIDVRETGEYVAGHVPGALHLPMSRLTSRLDELDRTAPVHVICASGNRSGAMTDVLIAQGFDAIDVRGGTNAWTRSGRPLVTGSHPSSSQ